MLINNGNHQTECVCLSLICLATNWTHQYLLSLSRRQHCFYYCCSCWKRCAMNEEEGYVKMTDRSEQGAPLSQGVERFAALSLCQQMATRVPVPPPTLRCRGCSVLFTCSRWTFPLALNATHLGITAFVFILINNKKKCAWMFIIAVRFTTLVHKVHKIIWLVNPARK